ncbi:hypothetical protein QC761_0090150 [Podospora bellae-mahoneyi]|uniref:Uncharacterized protein n=1 Tax=Podospora bellae-mahoneyi TaxID=2093777 RepID=A0ABR0F8F0_9PEZI|nr:hypothetical protein QC761_0090150 [Podospora bellae-mahoneyi]
MLIVSAVRERVACRNACCCSAEEDESAPAEEADGASTAVSVDQEGVAAEEPSADSVDISTPAPANQAHTSPTKTVRTRS